MKKERTKDAHKENLKVISLGGLQEIGKNMTVLEYANDIIVIDSGMGFPDEDMPGIDLVIPDISYLVKNAEKIRGILITHGHEDHIGAIPYVLKEINVPIYGTRLSLGIIEGKLSENSPGYDPDFYTVEAGDVVNLGVFKAEFIHVNHSIADACAIAVKTPVGTVFHTGDFKIDVSPTDGQMIDLTRIGEIGKAGVELLLCESTNAERPGYTFSERTVGSSLERIVSQYEDKRLVIATFSSNVHRV
jgi:ribonuclease J